MVKLTRLRVGIAAAVATAVVSTAAGVYAADPSSGTFTMSQGSSLNLACPNALSNGNVAANSETVDCAPTPPPPTCADGTGVVFTGTAVHSRWPAGYSNSNYVDNNMWSASAGPQTLNVCSLHAFFTVSNQVSNGGSVETYANVCGCTFNDDRTPASMANLSSAFSEGADPTLGEWNAGYDMWSDNNPGVWKWDNEVMIDNEQGGHPEDRPYPAGSTAVTIDGVAYHAGHNITGTAADGGNKTFTYFLRDSYVKSGSVNIKDFYAWLAAVGWVPAQTYMVGIGYGIEVSATQSSPGVQGAQRFDVSGYTLTSDEDNI